MKKTTTKIETREYAKITHTICDICDKVHIGDEWSDDAYEVLNTKISFEHGHNYPECGSTTVISIDVCPACFVHKVVPAIKKLGGNFSEKECCW